jgi:hypothetical protein
VDPVSPHPKKLKNDRKINKCGTISRNEKWQGKPEILEENEHIRYLVDNEFYMT